MELLSQAGLSPAASLRQSQEAAVQEGQAAQAELPLQQGLAGALAVLQEVLSELRQLRAEVQQLRGEVQEQRAAASAEMVQLRQELAAGHARQ